MKKRKDTNPAPEKPMTLYDYRILRDELQKCLINVTTDRTDEDMGGHLHAFLDYLCPARGIDFYDVEGLIDIVRKVRDLYKFKDDLVTKTEEFIEFLDDEIRRLEEEKNG